MTEAPLLKHFSLDKAIKLHILIVRLQRYLFSMQRSCALLYCHLLPVRIYRRFPHYLINVTIAGKKKVPEHKMCCFDFLYQTA